MTTWTKGEIVNDAFAEIGLVNYVFDLDDEQLILALRKLDNIMAMLRENGISLGFPVSLSPSESALTQESGVPNYAYNAIIKKLAIGLAPTVGKTVSPDLKKEADEAYTILTITANTPRAMQMPRRTPAGAGNSHIGSDRIFLTPPEDTIQIGEFDYKILGDDDV